MGFTEISKILTNYTLLERQRVNLPEYVRFMRINDDSSKIRIESHSFKITKINNFDVAILTSDSRRHLETNYVT